MKIKSDYPEPQEGPRWLEFAHEDLETAKVLYNNKRYRPAIFHLQQASEKLAKGILLLTNILPSYIEPRDARYIRRILGFPMSRPRAYGHGWLRKLMDDLKKSVNSFEQLAEVLEELPLNSDAKQNIKKFKDLLPGFKEKAYAAEGAVIKGVSLAEVKSTVDSCRKFIDLIKPLTENMTSSISPKLQELRQSSFVRDIERHYGVRLDRRMKTRLNKLLMDVELFRVQIKHSILIIPIGTLSIVLNPHEWSTRYPDVEQKIEYSEDNPVIQCFSEIEEVLRKCLEEVEYDYLYQTPHSG
jgi:HEPN domain-containing protein